MTEGRAGTDCWGAGTGGEDSRPEQQGVDMVHITARHVPAGSSIAQLDGYVVSGG